MGFRGASGVCSEGVGVGARLPRQRQREMGTSGEWASSSESRQLKVVESHPRCGFVSC